MPQENKRDIIISALRHLRPDTQRRSIGVEFTTPREDLVIRLPLEIAELLIPSLVKASEDLKAALARRAVPASFFAKGGEVSSLSDGTIVFDFVTPKGAHFPIRMHPSSVIEIIRLAREGSRSETKIGKATGSETSL